jgi:hypothetical protein
MQMKVRRYVVVVLGGLAVLVAGYCLLRDHYRPAIADVLQGELRQVSFAPHGDRELVRVTDIEEMEAIREATLSGRSLALGSWPPADCPLQFQFVDGRVVSLSISPTGISAMNVARQDAETFSPLKYVTLKWNGYHRSMDSRPFLDALRRQDRIASPDHDGKAKGG